MLEAYQKKTIELMHRQEILLARLYDIFSAKFYEYGAFWNDLAKEERKHAEWIKKLYQAEKKDLVAFKESKINISTMNTYIDHVENIIKRAQNDEVDLKLAAIYTLDLEKSLIEKNVFAHFQANEPKVKGIMTRLESETRKHVKKVQDLLAEI